MGGYAEFRPGEGREPAPVTVRGADGVDVDDIVRIERAAGRDGTDPSSHLQALADPAHHLFVAECRVGDRLAVTGWARVFHHTDATDDAPPGYYLGGLGVDPDWRRRGIGRTLTSARLRWISERADEVFYTVNPANLASLALHAPWGFVEVLRARRLLGGEFAGGTGVLLRADLAGFGASDG